MNDREKLVELLGRVQQMGVIYRENQMDERYPTIEQIRNTEVAARLIANGVAVPQWISVEDRLPESGVHVLLCCEIYRYGGEIAGKYVCDGYYAGANKIIADDFTDEYCEYSEEDDEYYLCEGWYEVIKNWDDYSSVAVEDFVTHWMPLPELPKGE